MKKKLPTTHLWRLFLISCIGLSLLTLNLEAQQLDSLSLHTKDSLLQIRDTLISNDTNVIAPQKEFKGKVTLEGQLRDYTTSEPLSFATLFFPNTAVGMRSDIDGKFKFELAQVPGDTIYITLGAQEIVNYMVAKGVARKRLKATGMGESVPVNGCVDGVICTEAEYRRNRRTEFKVVEIR